MNCNAKLSPIDNRDYIFTTKTYNTLPSTIDLRSYVGEIENQLSTGSCVANAVVSSLELSSAIHGSTIDLSRLFLYYNLREPYDNLNGNDSGAYLRDGFKSVSKLGICTEDIWDFNINNVNVKPTESCYTQAIEHKVLQYERVISATNTESNVAMTKAALAMGFPVVFTIQLGYSFYNLSGNLETQEYIGIDNDAIGSHAMCIVGYDDSLDGFIVENSWGNSWGDNGLFLLKYDVFLRDCPEAWVCTGFDGIIYNPTWIDNSPDILLTNTVNDIIQYKEDGPTFKAEISVSSGVTPLTYEWFSTDQTGTFTTDNGEPSISFLKSDYTKDSIVTCIVTGGGPLKKQATGYFIFKYIDEYEIKPGSAFIDDECNISITSLSFGGKLYDVILTYSPNVGTWIMTSIIDKE